MPHFCAIPLTLGGRKVPRVTQGTVGCGVQMCGIGLGRGKGQCQCTSFSVPVGLTLPPQRSPLSFHCGLLKLLVLRHQKGKGEEGDQIPGQDPGGDVMSKRGRAQCPSRAGPSSSHLWWRVSPVAEHRVLAPSARLTSEPSSALGGLPWARVDSTAPLASAVCQKYLLFVVTTKNSSRLGEISARGHNPPILHP